MQNKLSLLVLLCVLLSACGSSDSEPIQGSLKVTGKLADFGKVGKNEPSEAQELMVSGSDIENEIVVQISGEFELSENGKAYVDKLNLSGEKVQNGLKLFVRCKAQSVGELQGVLSFSGSNVQDINFDLLAEGVEKLIRVSTFNRTRHAFGGGHNQKADGSFNFPSDPTKVENIMMYVKLECPGEGCNAWDMFANIRIQDPMSEQWWEIGRYITPYGVDNLELAKGFPIDVTDFKSLLTGDVNLRSFIEVWGADGWLVSVDFEIIEGTPDYQYYALTPLLDYAQHSLAGIPYGVEHDFNLEKCVTIPANAEETSMRTTISGWGHATPSDSDGRPCAEWCFRTHDVLINEQPIFQHNMKGIGCDRNKVQPQFGNWQPDRAGWCPGMEVPVRTDIFDYARAGESFCYKYQLEPWVNDMQSTADNKNAYYAITSFIVVKSNTPVEPAIAG